MARVLPYLSIQPIRQDEIDAALGKLGQRGPPDDTSARLGGEFERLVCCRGKRTKINYGRGASTRARAAGGGGEPSDAAFVRGDRAADRSATLAGRIGRGAKATGQRREGTERWRRNRLK